MRRRQNIGIGAACKAIADVSRMRLRGGGLSYSRESLRKLYNAGCAYLRSNPDAKRVQEDELAATIARFADDPTALLLPLRLSNDGTNSGN